MTGQTGGNFMPFPREEFAARRNRVQDLMRRRNMDAVLVTNTSTLYYMTGYRSSLFNSTFRPLMALFPANGQPRMILPTLEAGSGIEMTPYPDIYAWGTTKGALAPDALTATQQLLTELGLANGRVGIERGTTMRLGMNLGQFEQLQSMLSDVTWVDSGDLLWEARRVKSPAEIACLRESQRILDAAYHAVVDHAERGMTELELLRILGSTMMLEGADIPTTQNIQSGPLRYKMGNPVATTRQLEPGDMVILDIGTSYNGYRSDITRGFFIERVSDRQRELYNASVEITAEAVEAVRPGVTCAEIDAVATNAINRRGYADLVLHRTGHAIGVEGHELPSLGPGDQTVLEPGMVITVEPALYDFDEGCFRMEDMILVTEDGYEYLSHARRDLVVK